MIEKMLRTSSFIAISIVLSFSIFFTCWTRTDAATPGFTPPENYRKDDSPGMVVEPSEINEDVKVPKDEIDMKDIFGSEQVFPFEMGLGNSAF